MKRTLEQRLMKHVSVGDKDQCWLWKGPKDRDGYGHLTVDHKDILAHRLSLEIFLGRPIRPELWVLHKCNNPMCVNPSHLYEGTAKDNTKDSIAAGTHPTEKIRSGAMVHPKAKLTAEQVVEIGKRLEAGESPSNLAKEYRVSRTRIYEIKNKKHWLTPPTLNLVSRYIF
jgi:hypothetical protein